MWINSYHIYKKNTWTHADCVEEWKILSIRTFEKSFDKQKRKSGSHSMMWLRARILLCDMKIFLLLLRSWMSHITEYTNTFAPIWYLTPFSVPECTKLGLYTHQRMWLYYKYFCNKKMYTKWIQKNTGDNFWVYV